jgi:hypothetical protein
MIKLILQGLGARRYYGLAAALQRRQQVREGFARARSGLNDELVEVRDRFGDSPLRGLCSPKNSDRSVTVRRLHGSFWFGRSQIAAGTNGFSSRSGFSRDSHTADSRDRCAVKI